MKREFDLNIEKVLENWNVYHAVREIIANALDEQMLTETAEIQIFKDDENRWHIRDFGRGLKYTHFTQNENAEKLTATKLIGKFGVGLKDAFATFDRHGIGVEIDSKFGYYTLQKNTKHGFDDLTTLHVSIEDSRDEDFVGTDFILTNCDDCEIAQAKDLFLQYANLTRLDETSFGEVYAKRGDMGEIFVNGMKVAKEENFLFSYNITAPSVALKRALNRERTNVGRGAYSERVKEILLRCQNEKVSTEFVKNLNALSGGEQSDELKWKDVQIHFLEILSKQEDVIFVTAETVANLSGRTREIVDDSEKRKVFVSENILESLREKAAEDDNFKLNTIESVVTEYCESFQFRFVEIRDLTEAEKQIFGLASKVIAKIFPHFDAHRIRISETMRPDVFGDETLGLCENGGERIVILRRILRDKTEFLGTLAHELVHAKSGFSDCSRGFEHALTEEIGKLLAQAA